MVTLETVREVLIYNSETGGFTWRVRRKGVVVGERAGCSNGVGYWFISIFNKRYYAHRLAWLLMTGRWPVFEVDHINGDRSDNRWINLRAATHKQNKRNGLIHKDNKSGFKGVSYEPARRKYAAHICVNYKRKFLGRYTTAEEAHEAYKIASAELHGEFGRTR